MMLQQEQKFGKKMLTSILFVSIGAYTTFSHDRDKQFFQNLHIVIIIIIVILVHIVDWNEFQHVYLMSYE